MSRGPSTFRQRDLRAAVKAVIDAGVEVTRVIVDRAGNINIETGKPAEGETENPWDEVYHEKT